MSEISEIPPFSFEVGEISETMLNDLDKVANTPPHSVADEMIKMLTHEIRRLRAENEELKAERAKASWTPDDEPCPTCGGVGGGQCTMCA